MRLHNAKGKAPTNITSGDVSLCKIKVKRQRSRSQYRYESRDPYTYNEEEGEKEEEKKGDVQQYAVSTKQRAIVLQFESPMLLKKKNATKKGLRAKGNGRNKTPPYQGAVQGIKNLPAPSTNKQKKLFVQKKGEMKRITVVDGKKMIGAPRLEGKYIEFDPNFDQPGPLRQGSCDKDSYVHSRRNIDESDESDEVSFGEELNDSDGDDEDDVMEEGHLGYDNGNNNVRLEVEDDDNYYKSFLKSIQCRVSVQQIKCDDDLQCLPYKKDVMIAPKNFGKNRERDVKTNMEGKHSSSEDDILVAWSGENDINRYKSSRNIEIRDDFDKLTGSDIDNYSDFVQDVTQPEKDEQEGRKQDENVWKLQSLFGDLLNNKSVKELMSYTVCGKDYIENCAEKAREEANQFIPTVESEISLDPPTALYAAIGMKNWNVALRRLMEAPEEAGEWVVSGKSDDDTIFEFLPLHLACLTNAPLLLVTLLLQACPDAVEEDTMGKLPIHMACEAQVDHRTVFLLLNRFPESLQIEDEDGNTPIEIASFADASEERKKIIQILTRKMENTVVRTPTSLYHAIDCQDWNYAMRHLVAMPQESTIWVSFTTKKTEIRFLPLHAACLMGAPLLLVEDLIQAYPDAIRKKTSDGKLPLHLVCESLPDCRVVKLLVDQYKDALQIKNNEGNTPLDVVSSMLISPERSEIIEILMSEEQNDDENIVYTHTKLHALIEERQWDGAVRRVLEAPDEASTWFSADKKTNKVKYLPLHKACTLRAPLILVAVLIQTYPDCVKKVGIARKLPIHIACENRTDHGVISFLLHSWPASFHAKDGKGLTCIQSALLSTPSSHRTKIIQALTAFEDKDGQPLTLQASETTKDENRNGDINGYQNKGSTYVQESLDSDEDIVKVEPVRKSRAKKKIYYTGKKHLFQRRKTKMLWDKDDKMFQSE